MNNFDDDFEKAIRFLALHMPNAEDLEKPTLFHSIRVGIYLFQNDYNREVCIAGLLHDLIEDTNITKESISNEFGNVVADFVDANSKKETIENKYEDLISRCIKAGESALIVKAADIIDNYNYYKRLNNKEGLEYVLMITKLLLEQKPESFNDPIFDALAMTNS